MGGTDDATNLGGEPDHGPATHGQGPPVNPGATTSPMSPPLSLGAWIGRYRLLERLDKNRSGFGQVFLARRNDAIQLSVAIKVIRPGMDTRDVLARFEQERRLLAVLDHPNIAKILDAGETQDGRPYFVMELIRGDIITTFADQHALTIDQRVALMIPVCEGVQYAHVRGIVHRDIKPGNIMVAEGVDARPMVIDFGIAKVLAGPLSDTTLTTRGPLGTPDYVSPEQARGEAVDAATDVYGLCAVLYHLVTGKAPLEHLNLRLIPDELLFPAIAAATPRRPRAISRQLPQDLETILLCGLHPDRKRRYRNAGELGEDLRRYLEGQPIRAKADSPLYTLRTRFSGLVAHNVGAAVIIGWLLCVLLGLGVFERFAKLLPGPALAMQSLVQRAAPADADALAPLRDVRVVEFRADATPEDIAKNAGVQGVDPARKPSARRLYAEIVKRAARAGAKVILLDVTFRSPSPHDDPILVEALAECRRRGTRVVLGCNPWPVTPATAPDISNAVLELVDGTPLSPVIGGQLINNTKTPEPMLNVFVRRGDADPSPHASVLAAGAFVHPDLGASHQLGADEGPRLVLGFWSLNPSGGRVPSEDRRTLPLMELQPVKADTASDGKQLNDLVGLLGLKVRDDQVLDAAACSAAQALSMDPAAFASMVQGRVLIIGDQRVDQHELFGGRVVSGPSIMACAVQRLIDILQTGADTTRTLAFPGILIPIALPALLGVLPGLRRKNRLHVLLVFLGVCAIFTLACVIGASMFLGYFTDPVSPLFSLFVGGLVGWSISRARASVPNREPPTVFRSSSGGAAL